MTKRWVQGLHWLPIETLCGTQLSLSVSVCPCVAHTRLKHTLVQTLYWQNCMGVQYLSFFFISLILLLIKGLLKACWGFIAGLLKAIEGLLAINSIENTETSLPTRSSTALVTFLRLGFLQLCHLHARRAAGCFLCCFAFSDLSLFVNAFGKWKSRRSHRIWRKPHQKCCDQTDETKEWCDDFFCPTLRTSQAVGHFKSLAKVPSQATCSGRVLKLCKPKSLKIGWAVSQTLFLWGIHLQWKASIFALWRRGLHGLHGVEHHL